MPLVIEGVNADFLKQKYIHTKSFRLAIMADDNVQIYMSSPQWEKGILLGSHSSLTSYKILNLTDIPIYDEYAHFIARISNGTGVSGVNIRNADNQKCFVPVSPAYWGGWGRASTSWANVGCWAATSLPNNSSVEWKVKIPVD